MLRYGLFTSRIQLKQRFFPRLFSVRGLQSNATICVVGTGPAGSYTSKYLMKALPNCRITMLDSLPTPYGLVRSGVAPDHADTKAVINDFSKVVDDERCCFIGNVKVGKDVKISELRHLYDVVVLACGAASDKSLNIPGEDLQGVHSARAFVNWYNGHPDFANYAVDLSSQSALVIGQGNVAIDCARILSSSTKKLESTDITIYALEALDKSSIQHVRIVGRRGPAQAAFTNKELREVCEKVPGCRTFIDDAEKIKGNNPESLAEIKNIRAVKRKMTILDKVFADPEEVISQLKSKEYNKIIQFQFFLSPKEFKEDPNKKGHVGSVVFQRTVLEGPEGQQKAINQPDDTVELPAGLVLKSIGYAIKKMDEVPYDEDKCVVPSEKGRILDAEGLYVTGWLKRGPTGIIATNIVDAQETVGSILEDLEIVSKDRQNQDNTFAETVVKGLLQARNVEYVDKEGWKQIDEEEKRRGEQLGKVKEKIVTIREMIDHAKP